MILGTGVYASWRLPSRQCHAVPPPSASVGLLRPGPLARTRRLATVLLGLAVGLVLTGRIADPTPLESVRALATGGTVGTPWLETGEVGAPALTAPLNTTLALTFVGAATLGTLAGVLSVSAGGWYGHHSGLGTYRPAIRDSLAGLGALGVGGIAVAGSRLPFALPGTDSLPVAVASAFGVTGGTPTGATLGCAGLLALLVATLFYVPSNRSATMS